MTNAKKIDEWDGEDYEGTSVRALFKVLKAKEYIEAYEWAFTHELVLRQVLTTGPVVMGTNWYHGMHTPDFKNYIWPTGELVGGHAWLLIGAYRNKKNPDGTVGAFRMINSWARDWGQKGRAWLTFKTLNQLIKQDGEACVAVEKKHQ